MDAKKIIIIIIGIIVIIGIVLGLIISSNINKSSKENENRIENVTTTSSTNKKENIEEKNEKEKEKSIMYNSGIHHAIINVKNYGVIKLELYSDIAPITVSNFAKLVNEGFYDGLTFHRIIDGFMIQGGDPEGTGFGGSKETIKGEFKVNGINNNISHERGVISMARSTAYNSASSQFFIVQKDSTFLDGQYAGFGKVTEGIEIVDKICNDTKVEDTNGTVLKENQPIIEKIVMTD